MLRSSPRQYAPARPVSFSALIGFEFWRCGPAEVGEVALRVERDRPVGRVDELDLVGLPLLGERCGLLGVDLLARPLAALRELQLDLGLDLLQVLLADRLGNSKS